MWWCRSGFVLSGLTGTYPLMGCSAEVAGWAERGNYVPPQVSPIIRWKFAPRTFSITDVGWPRF